MPSMNGRIVPPWYPPPFDGTWGVWPHWPWWPQWPGAVDPLPPWANQLGPTAATRGPLSPEGFPASPSTPLSVAATPPTEPQTPSLPVPAFQLGAVLAGLRVARAQLDAPDPVAAQAAAAQAAFCVGFFAGVLGAQGTAVPALATTLPLTPKLTDALDLLIQVADGMLAPDKTRKWMSWSWDGAGSGCVEGGGLGFIGGAELGGAWGALGGAVGGCIAGGVIRGLTAGK